jgi:glycosyltransferase involved in cell wall biosynthesis
VPVPGVHPTQHWRMLEHLRRIPHDIYHYPHYDLPLSSCRPAVVTIHDLKFLRFPELLPNRLRSHYVRGAMRIGARRARHIVAVSSSTREDLEELLGVPPYRVTVIPEAAATEGLERGHDGTSRYVDPASLPQGIRPGYLLFVGERRPHKNLVNLIRAYARAREIVPSLPDLVIVGHRHADYAEPERTVELVRLKPHVHFFDGVGDRTLQALYAHAGVFLLPSLYEGFGLPILEAMMAGVPVLTSNISSMPEVAGDAALLVDPYDIESIAKGMCRLTEEPRLRHELITKGRLWSRQFTWQRVARATFRVYRKVLAGIRT